ncbi:MAG: thermonuclease family protein [Bacilli bacterium]|nr:thermonuclease family protein [Bacilli bacterium]
MKKIFLTLFLFFIGIIGVSAKTIEVEFSECVDGDTAKFIYKDEEITARFLAIDTPETVHPTKDVEEFGKEASDYTCNKIKNAEEIKLEYDEDSDETDKYDRHLVWVFVDGQLLQKKLISKGYASVAYLYGDYKYTEELEITEQEAEDNKLGIWSLEDTTEETEEKDAEEETQTELEKEDSVKTVNDYKELIILIGIIVMLCLFSTKARKKVKNKAKKELIKELKKRFK